MVTTTKPRQKRIPLSGGRNILTVASKDPNYVYRWVNDEPGRIERFKLAGYEVVTDSLEIGDQSVDRNTKLGSAVTKTVGGTKTAVLMRILREWYDEDQEAKQAEIDDLDASMRAGKAGDYGKVEINRK